MTVFDIIILSMVGAGIIVESAYIFIYATERVGERTGFKRWVLRRLSSTWRSTSTGTIDMFKQFGILALLLLIFFARLLGEYPMREVLTYAVYGYLLFWFGAKLVDIIRIKRKYE